MTNKIKAICWETNCFLALFNKEQGRVDICNAIIESAKKGEIKLYTSYLTICECAKIKDEYASEAEEIIAKFFKHKYIIPVAISYKVSRITRNLVREHKLEVKDAIHLATAISIKADELQTWDGDDLLKLNGKIPNIKLEIVEPAVEFQTTFPEQTTNK